MKTSPILLEIFKNRFAAVCEQMGMTLARTAYSPNIKERRDLSCALFDASGEMVAQAAHIPVHLGSMPLSVKAAIEAVPMGPGDMAVLNDPFRGGTHLPDVTLVAPVCGDGGEVLFYVANRAHHADVGGMAPGSMPMSTSLFQEGLVIPPVALVRGGRVVPEVMEMILANVRTPQEREGDFAAQIMANATGVQRMSEMAAKYGRGQVAHYAAALVDYCEAMCRAAVALIPDGRYEFEDLLEDDGQGTEDIPVRLALTVSGEAAELDFTASGDQVAGSVNAVRSITLSAVLYVFRCLVERDVPANAGIMRPLTVRTRPGSVLDAQHPAAVAGGNVETSQRVADVVLGALAKALPGRIPAASQGTMNNVTIGGFDPRRGRAFAYYETLAGGSGASARGPGEPAVHTHMTNTLNTPVEALEYDCPFLVRRYSIRRGSGGAGRHAGGDGLVREIEFTAPAEVSVLSERRRTGPYGLAGGEAGAPGVNSIFAAGAWRQMDAKFFARVQRGERLRIETPGGGGWGGKD